MFSTLKAFKNSLLLGVVAFLSAPASAAPNEAMLDLLILLKDKGAITASEYDILKNAAIADGEIIKDVEDKAKNLPKVTLEGKYSIESQDGSNSFTPIGRIMWDTILVDKDGSTAVKGGSELRRARLGFDAKMFTNWGAKLEYDFSGADADLKDGYISYDNSNSIGKYNVKVGQHHIPIGFNTVSSSKYMTFLQRPLFADGPMQPARQYGVSGQFHEKDFRWNINAGWFLDEPEDGIVNVDGAGEDRQYVSVRATGIPLMKDTKHMLHIGASFMNSDPNGDDFRIRQRLLTHLDTSRLLDTGNLGDEINDVNTWDLELLGIYGPVHGLFEYISTNADSLDGDADFSAWSFETGYFLTGESKKYDKAAFGSLTPKKNFGKGGIGAWEIALRYENMDLNDVDAGITGGDANLLTAGINWYPNKNIRLMADYSTVTDFNRTGNSSDSKEPSALSFRTQVYW